MAVAEGEAIRRSVAQMTAVGFVPRAEMAWRAGGRGRLIPVEKDPRRQRRRRTSYGIG